jgi:hypothetical protein
MTSSSPSSNGQTRLAYILGVPLAPDCQRQWPQLGEVVHGRDLIGEVEGGFQELTLGVGRRLQIDDIVVVEWSCNYGDGQLYRNVSIAELRDGHAAKVTDIGVNPPPPPNGANRSRIIWTCQSTGSGKTQNISTITEPVR